MTFPSRCAVSAFFFILIARVAPGLWPQDAFDETRSRNNVFSSASEPGFESAGTSLASIDSNFANQSGRTSLIIGRNYVYLTFAEAIYAYPIPKTEEELLSGEWEPDPAWSYPASPQSGTSLFEKGAPIYWGGDLFILGENPGGRGELAVFQINGETGELIATHLLPGEARDGARILANISGPLVLYNDTSGNFDLTKRSLYDSSDDEFGPGVRTDWNTFNPTAPADGPSVPLVSVDATRRFQQFETTIHAYEFRSSSALWTYEDTSFSSEGLFSGDDIPYEQAIFDDTLFVARQGGVLAIDLDSGNLLWEIPILNEEDFPEFDPEAPSLLALSGDVGVVTRQNETILAFRPSDGEILWERVAPEGFDFEHTIESDTLTISGNNLFTSIESEGGLAYNELIVLDLQTGDLKQQLAFDVPDNAGFRIDSIVPNNGWVYVANREFGREVSHGIDYLVGAPARLLVSVESQNDRCSVLSDRPSKLDVTVTNDGPGFARDIDLKVDISGSAELTSITGDCVITGPREASCFIESLPAGASKVFEVEFTPMNAGRTITTARLESASRLQPDSVLVNTHEQRIVDPNVPIDMTVAQIEVTQVLQDFNNSVPLIANKGTLVRVYADAGGDAFTEANATLRASGTFASSGESFDVDVPRFNQCISNPGGGPDRGDINHTFNFMIPRTYASADLQNGLTLTAEVNSDGFVPETDDTNNTGSVTVSFSDVPPLCVRAVSLPVEGGSGETLIKRGVPSLFIQERAEAMLPTPDVYYEPTNRVIWPGNLRNVGTWDLERNPVAWAAVTRLNAIAVTSFSPAYCDLLAVRPLVLGMVAEGYAGAFNGMAGLNGMIVRLSAPDNPEPDGIPEWNEPFGGRTLAHEIGHCLGRKHVQCGPVSDFEPQERNWPWDPCEYTPGGPEGIWGVDLADAGVEGDIRVIRPRSGGPERSHGPLMSYANRRWISPENYGIMGSRIDCQEGPPCGWPPSKDAHQFYENYSGRLKTLQGSSSYHLAYMQFGSEGTALNFGASFFNGDLPGQTLSTFAEKQAAAKQFDDSWTVEVLGIDQSVIDTISVSPEPLWDSASDIGGVEILAPHEGNLGGLRLKDEEQQIVAEELATSNAPSFDLSRPFDNQILDGPEMNLEWVNVIDTDSDELTAIVQYSPDNGTTWQTLAIEDGRESPEAIDAGALTGADGTGTVRVLMTDGFNTTVDLATGLTVPDRSPDPMIDVPSDGEVLPPGVTIFASGKGWDPEYGFLAADDLAWELNGEEVGNGEQVVLRDLAIGSYTLALTVRAINGEEATESVDFSVLPVTDVIEPASVNQLILY